MEGDQDKNLSIESLFGFPYKIPINYDDVNFGNVIIDFKINENLKKSAKGYLLPTVFAELGYLPYFLKEDLKIALDFFDRNIYRMRNFGILFDLFYIQPGQSFNLLNYLYLKEQAIFDCIKSHGPTAFRFSIIQGMVQSWLLEESSASRKINKIRDSLMEFTYGSSFRNGLHKTGRGETEAMKILSEEGIVKMYQEVRQILKFAKIIQKSEKAEDTVRLIEKAFNHYILFLESQYTATNMPKEIKEKISKLKKYMKNFKRTKTADPVSEFIENDEELKKEFSKFKWSPYKISIKIIAGSLGISCQKIRDIIYRKST